jgi:hypothetical protein
MTQFTSQVSHIWLKRHCSYSKLHNLNCETSFVLLWQVRAVAATSQQGPPIAENKSTPHRTHRTHSLLHDTHTLQVGVAALSCTHALQAGLRALLSTFQQGLLRSRLISRQGLPTHGLPQTNSIGHTANARSHGHRLRIRIAHAAFNT